MSARAMLLLALVAAVPVAKADAADATKWRQSGAAKKLTDELDALGTFTFSAEASGAKTFWKVLGEDGEEAN